MNNLYQSYPSVLDKSNYWYYNNLTTTSTTYFINDVCTNTTITIDESTITTDVTEDNGGYHDSYFSTNFPLFFPNKNMIKIPSKVKYSLSRYTPKTLLKRIHHNTDVAIEMCLLFTTQLTSTYFSILDGSNPTGEKALKAEFLRQLLSFRPSTYKYVVEALEAPLKNGPILECDHNSQKGVKSYNYKLGDSYSRKGIVEYEVTTPEAIALLKKHRHRSYYATINNPIVQNLVKLYPMLRLPTLDQIQMEAKRLIESGHITSKGKTLGLLNKHKRSYFKHPEKMSFVEDSIEIFCYLTENGFQLPTAGNEASGGRVVDSITLMPSWIRKMIKIDGEPVIECDYSCLHPNIALSLYGGRKQFLTHQAFADELNMDILSVKIEHLSFFNKEVWQIKQSPLFKYYEEHEPTMLQKILVEKSFGKYKYKETSRRMFAKEVDIMSTVIQKLNQENIYVGYVYDALFCHPGHAERLKVVMDETILEHGVHTKVKVSSCDKASPATYMRKDVRNPVPLDDEMETQIESSSLRIQSTEISFGRNIRKEILAMIDNGTALNVVSAIIGFANYCDQVILVDDMSNPKGKYLTQSFLYGKCQP